FSLLSPCFLLTTCHGNEKKMKNSECEKMGGVCKHQTTHGCTILPAECKSRKKHCCRA
uniref:Beta-defensin 33 n=1 Tax=Phocoena sinus TaxID=42100 RepID=A0A8C9C240_PHOSS